MASLTTYLVSVDFSRASGRSLSYAIRLVREGGGNLLLVHVITDSPEFVPINLRADYYGKLRKKAERRIASLMRRRTHGEVEYRSLVIEGDDPARLISDQAKKSRAAMIVMGSQGHTGLKRWVLGSVAEKTVRYAQCPILIVKP